MTRRCDLSLALVVALGVLAPQSLLAHAAYLTAQEPTVISIRGQYDTGELMEGAQVLVFAPDNPAEPWTTGTADDLGRFLLFPDTSLPGRWTIQMRQAGHGAVIHVEVGEDSADAGAGVATGSTGAPQSLTQQLVMIALVGWGALGTALYFRRRRGGNASA